MFQCRATEEIDVLTEVDLQQISEEAAAANFEQTSDQKGMEVRLICYKA